MAIQSFKVEIVGVGELTDRLKDIGTKKARNAVRRAVSRGGTVLLQAARGTVASMVRKSMESTGLLQSSMGKKDSTHRAKSAYSIVGPRRGFKQVIAPKASKRLAKKLSKAGAYRVAKGKLKDPVRYAHLVGGGHKGPRGKGFVRARPFMLAAQLFAREQMINIMKLELTQALMAEAKNSTPDI